jgi:hypothetical protein
VDYQCHSYNEPDTTGDRSAYARVAQALADESLELALVDGVYRDHVALFLPPKIRPGGCWSSKSGLVPALFTLSPASVPPSAGSRDRGLGAGGRDLHALAPDRDDLPRTDTAIFVKAPGSGRTD